MRSPLIISGPGIPAGRSTPAFTYLFDLFPTICALAGVKPPDGLAGRDLRPLWEDERAKVRDSVFLPFSDLMRSVRDRRWKLIVYPPINYRQLFDLRDDPHETRDLAAEPGHEQEIARLTALMRAWQEKLGDEQPLAVKHPKPEVVDVPHAPVDGGLHLLERGVGVAGVAADALRTAGEDESLGARQFRGDRRGNDAVGEREILLLLGGDRWPHPGTGVGAAGLVGEVGAVEVRAQDPGTIRSVRLQPPAQAEESQVLLVAGHGRGRQEARGAVPGVGATGGSEHLLGPVHEVGPVAPVDLEVDEPGRQEAAPQVDAGPVVAPRLRVGPDRGNPCPIHLDECPREQPVFEDDDAAVEAECSETSCTRFRVLPSKPTGRKRCCHGSGYRGVPVEDGRFMVS
jgi:hypothetical protein